MDRHHSSGCVTAGPPGETRQSGHSALCPIGSLILLLGGLGTTFLTVPAVAGDVENLPARTAAGVPGDSTSERIIVGGGTVSADATTLEGNHTSSRWLGQRRWLIGGLLASLVIMAGIEMWKTATRRGRRFTQGRLLPVSRVCSRIQRRHQAAGLGVVLLTSMMLSLKQTNGTLNQENLALHDTVQYLQQRLESYTNPTIENLYGVPPVPHRPDHPRRISGIYYQGNCARLDEQQHRNPTGNFRTATLHVGICDAEDNLIDVGDSIAGRELFLRVEMERSPFTEDALYSSEAMDNTFFSHEYHRQTDQFESQLVRFQVLQKDQRWVAYYPIDVAAAAEGALTGLVYLYRKTTAEETQVEDQPAEADLRYGIRYELRLRDGRLTEESDVHMGALFCHPRLAIPQPGKIPLAECFSHIAIPEKHSSSIDDPELLGISEYLQQNSEPQLRGPSAN